MQITRPHDPAFDLLHSLRVKGLASPAVLGGLSGVPEAELADALEPLVRDELVVHREGRFGGYLLTPAGKAAAAETLASDSATIAAQGALSEFYAAFLPVNGAFKAVCHRWQMVSDGVPNDHTDPAYDDAVIAELAALATELEAHLDNLAQALPRFGRYHPRLAAALARVQSGDVASFARPMYDSYHDIWMELHQDLLVSLGRERGAADEGTP